MKQRKYTLPRHTNLADQGPRIGAFFIDLAINMAVTLGLFFGCFSLIFKNKTNVLYDQINNTRLESHLFVENDKGEIKYCSALNDNQAIMEHLHYFYTVYLPVECEDANEPVILKDGTEKARVEYFTTEWFNENILRIESDGANYFEYSPSGHEVLGLLKDGDEVTISGTNAYLRQVINDLADPDLKRQTFYKKLNNEYGFYNSLELVMSLLIGGVVSYIVIPICFKNGQSLGKKLFGLSLADSDGYKMRNSQLFMRIMPYFVICLSFLLPIWNQLVTEFIVPIIVLLVSGALVMASPKRSSLHDFCARTIVVNARTSIIFENIADQEAYILKEDNIEPGEEIID